MMGEDEQVMGSNDLDERRVVIVVKRLGKSYDQWGRI